MLNRYFDILKKEKLPFYLLAKNFEVNTNLNSTVEEMWMVHNSAVNKFRNEISKIELKTNEDNENISLLDLKIKLAEKIFENCIFCERKCRVNRKKKIGHCKVQEAKISSEFLHFGEEPMLVPSYTIFFSGCTFNCVFCQNYDISQNYESGVFIPPKTLARIIEKREKNNSNYFFYSGKAKNVNWVGGDPTSNLFYILQVLKECNSFLPQIWNSNMYLTEESMKLLDGIIDVYLTDFKYGNDSCAERLSNVKNYLQVIKRNHLLAEKTAECIIRHLVLPNHIECCTFPILKWISENMKNSVVNIMEQYHPEHRAIEFNEISRKLTREEFLNALSYAKELKINLV